jgi:zinc protease
MTVYHALVTANALPKSLELEADRLQHLNLWDENFEKELQVVIEERRLRVEDDPQQRFSERFFAEVLTANPYQNPVIGWQHDLDNLSTTDLRTFYNTWYAPNNATLIIVGDVNTKDMHALVQKFFGKIPAKPVPAKKPVVLLRAFGEKRLTMNIPAQVPVISLAYEVPTYATHKTPRDIAALSLTAIILDGDASSRLTQKLLREKNLAASVRVEYDQLMRFPTLFTFSATPSGSHTLAELEQALLEEISLLQQTPVTDKELQRAKTLWLANTTYTSDSVDQQALKIGVWENIGLPWETADTFDALIQTITPNDIQAVAQQYLGPNNRSVGFLIPASQGT